jgi:dimeric dUTPase (all-alpha-NTP-PPase superfamily)
MALDVERGIFVQRPLAVMVACKTLHIEHCRASPGCRQATAFAAMFIFRTHVLGRNVMWEKLFGNAKTFLEFCAQVWYYLDMEVTDQFRELFRMQHELNQRIGVNTDAMTEEEKTKWVLNYCRAMSQEIAELTDSVPWKWWAKYQKFDEQNARVEVVDLFHFLISLAQVLGMGADEVFNAYVKKNLVNFKRQDSGYTIKDQEDSRHI